MCIASRYSIVVSYTIFLFLLETKRAFIDKMIAATLNCINNKSPISVSNQFMLWLYGKIVHRFHMALKMSTISAFVCMCLLYMDHVFHMDHVEILL